MIEFTKYFWIIQLQSMQRADHHRKNTFASLFSVHHTSLLRHEKSIFNEASFQEIYLPSLGPMIKELTIRK